MYYYLQLCFITFYNDYLKKIVIMKCYKTCVYNYYKMYNVYILL